MFFKKRQQIITNKQSEKDFVFENYGVLKSKYLSFLRKLVTIYNIQYTKERNKIDKFLIKVEMNELKNRISNVDEILRKYK